MEQRQQEQQLIKAAAEGSGEAKATLLEMVSPMIFTLALRMTGMHEDAEDAHQEILLRILDGLPGFRSESSFSTWCYRIAVNHLLNLKEYRLSRAAFSFEQYGADIDSGFCSEPQESVESGILAEELKASCTNVMLQCFDPESRCIYALGTLFHPDSRVAAEVLEMSPQNYRKRLSRLRGQMGGFLAVYCGLTQTGRCRCENRIGYAMAQERLSSSHLPYSSANRAPLVTEAMEELDELGLYFRQQGVFRASSSAKKFLQTILESSEMRTVKDGEGI